MSKSFVKHFCLSEFFLCSVNQLKGCADPLCVLQIINCTQNASSNTGYSRNCGSDVEMLMKRLEALEKKVESTGKQGQGNV